MVYYANKILINAVAPFVAGLAHNQPASDSSGAGAELKLPAAGPSLGMFRISMRYALILAFSYQRYSACPISTNW